MIDNKWLARLACLVAGIFYLLIWCGLVRADDPPPWKIKDVHVKFVDFGQESYKFRVTATAYREGSADEPIDYEAHIYNPDGFAFIPHAGAAHQDALAERVAVYGVDVFEDREVRCWSAEIRSMLYPPGLADPYDKQGFFELADWVEEEQEPLDPEADPLEYECCPEWQFDPELGLSSSPYGIDDVMTTDKVDIIADDVGSWLHDFGLPDSLGSDNYLLSFDIPYLLTTEWTTINTNPSGWFVASTAGDSFRQLVRGWLAIVFTVYFILAIIRRVVDRT